MKKTFEVLLADDNAVDRFIFESALVHFPVPVAFRSVEDGEKLIQFLHDNRKALPDVIFLDLNMPRKNGYECLSEIKADRDLRHIPVVMYSTALPSEVVDLCLRQGAYYLEKGSLDELSASIAEVLTKVINDTHSELQNVDHYRPE